MPKMAAAVEAVVVTVAVAAAVVSEAVVTVATVEAATAEAVAELVQKNDAIIMENVDQGMKLFQREEIVMAPFCPDGHG